MKAPHFFKFAVCLIILPIVFSNQTTIAQENTLREKIRERLKERFVKKLQDNPQ
ncbi:MAG: hypothetical protein H7281_06175 [Bacteriovorax sp.]|nr:hypothetical protein [Bacteriovorax sp.]